MKRLTLLMTFGLSITLANANVRTAKIFGSNMVLQRNQLIPVWGWADKGETVTVQFHNQKQKVRTDNSGKWKVNLKAENAGGPYTLVVMGKNTLKFENILVGDVWVCSGQSNMEWPLSAARNAKEEIAAANYPQIRHFKVKTDAETRPKADLQFESSWKAANPENAGEFTAVGYFFARNLYKELNVPIGLINTTWGGTDIETWMSRESFESSEDFTQMIAGMPTIDFATLSRQKLEAQTKLIKEIQGFLPDRETVATWSQATFSDEKWQKMNVPQVWEEQALKEVDGTVWLRRSVEIEAADAGKTAVLNLAMIDDSDVTYLNGVRIGSTNGHDLKRSYQIPSGALKAGKNVIAVRVDDFGSGGGIYGSPADVSLVVNQKSIPLAGQWSFAIEALRNGSANPNSLPTLLYNAMVHPLIPFAIKGVIWYQGENNAGRASEYAKSFPLMINDWRKQWGQGAFPFYFTQLSSYNASNGNSQTGSTWAELREAQEKTLSLENTGMAVTTDIGEARDIHPRNKQDVGSRLAAIALRKTYGKSTPDAGPTYRSMKKEGNKIRISFSDTGSGLFTKDKYGYLYGFDIAGKDKKFRPAKAVIEGDEVIVYQEGVTEPEAVRYNWADFAGEGNLYNQEGFPAAPFRTDDWEGITAKNRYTIPK